MGDEWADEEIEEALAQEASQNEEEAALIAEAERAEAALRRATAFVAENQQNPLDKSGPTCDECGAVSLDNRMLSTFKEHICAQCRNNNPKFKLLTKTKAKEEFLVTDDDIRLLSFVETSNPRRQGWSMMKLYLTKHVEALAVKRWGDIEAVEREKERRAVERVLRREKRAKTAQKRSKKEETDTAFRKNIKKLRGELGDSVSQESAPSVPSPTKTFVPKNDLYHTHEFGMEEPVEDSVFVKTCKSCGFQVRVEKL